MFSKTFTDPQGVTHTNAVFKVANANYNVNTDENFHFDLGTNTPTTSNTGNNSLNYRMYYWPNQASLDNGNLPYVLANSNSNELGEIHYVNNLDATYDALTAEAKAEEHCQAIVLV